MAGFLLVALIVLSFCWILLSTPPEKLARLIKFAAPVLMGGLGLGLLYIGRGGLGLPLIGFAMALYARMRTVSRLGGSSKSKSNVRSAALDMSLDHDTGEMDGLILAGSFEGKMLEELDDEDLIILYQDLLSDPQSVLLLEAYLDRRIPGWREDTDGDIGAGQVYSPGTGSMSKQEAYEVLGLLTGAGPGEIRKAHRRLMKGMHPDGGGSTFLAAKINEAKEVLLKGHTK